jgi:hypothetical protein
VVEGLEIKPYLFGNAIQNYLLCNFKLVDENLDKIMFDRQLNVKRINIENDFGNLKNRSRILHCINACVDKVFKIMMVCYVFHNYYQLMVVPLPVKGL